MTAQRSSTTLPTRRPPSRLTRCHLPWRAGIPAQARTAAPPSGAAPGCGPRGCAGGERRSERPGATCHLAVAAAARATQGCRRSRRPRPRLSRRTRSTATGGGLRGVTRVEATPCRCPLAGRSLPHAHRIARPLWAALCSGWLDANWRKELGSRMPPGDHYIDFTGSGLYTNSQLAAASAELASKVSGAANELPAPPLLLRRHSSSSTALLLPAGSSRGWSTRPSLAAASRPAVAHATAQSRPPAPRCAAPRRCLATRTAPALLHCWWTRSCPGRATWCWTTSAQTLPNMRSCSHGAQGARGRLGGGVAFLQQRDVKAELGRVPRHCCRPGWSAAHLPSLRALHQERDRGAQAGGGVLPLERRAGMGAAQARDARRRERDLRRDDARLQLL